MGEQLNGTKESKTNFLTRDISKIHEHTAHFDNKTEHLYSFLQVLTAAVASFAHGSNDAQKSMGIITLALVAYAASLGEKADLVVPVWVIVACATAMALGTLPSGAFE